MGKTFKQFTRDPRQCRIQIDEFGALLKSKAALSEKDDILPFFKKRPQVAAFIGSYMRDIGPSTDYVFEYPFYGDFAADLIVGDEPSKRYCVVEFEDGRKNSIFVVPKGRSTTEWSRRFDHGFSQMVDWFSLLDDLKKTQRFKRDFGDGHIRFSALLVIGRDAGIAEPYDRYRLNWRTEKIRVDSHSIECITFDGLHEHMDRHLRLNTGY